MTEINNTNTSNLLSRRVFFERTGLLFIGMSTMGISCFKPTKELRFIAYNVLKCTGFPSDKMKDKTQMPALMASELAKYKPDIINFSESPEESIVKEIAGRLKMNYVMFPSAGNWPGAIITHLDIMASVNVPILNGDRPSDLFTRHWGKAKIKLQDGSIIIVHSAHLYPHDTPESGAIRKRELNYITEAIVKDAREYDSVILMGDLNLSPDLPEYGQLMNAQLTDTFAKVGKGDGLTIRSDKPTKRIDYIMVKGSLAGKITESRPLYEGAFRTDPAVPDSFALSDHIPQYAVFNL